MIKELCEDRTKKFESEIGLCGVGKNNNVVITTCECTVLFSLIIGINTDIEWTEVKKKYAPREKELLLFSMIDEKYKWVACDKDGDKWAYANKPIRETTHFNNVGSTSKLVAFNDTIKITWDDEPFQFRE